MSSIHTQEADRERKREKARLRKAANNKRLLAGVSEFLPFEQERAKLRQGVRTDLGHEVSPKLGELVGALEHVGARLGISAAEVYRIRTVRDGNSPELLSLVLSGESTWGAACAELRRRKRQGVSNER